MVLSRGVILYEKLLLQALYSFLNNLLRSDYLIEILIVFFVMVIHFFLIVSADGIIMLSIKLIFTQFTYRIDVFESIIFF